MSCKQEVGHGVRGEIAAHCPTGLATKRGIAELCKFTGKTWVGQTFPGQRGDALRPTPPSPYFLRKVFIGLGLELGYSAKV